MQSTQPKSFVFVLMPFDEGFEDIYKVGIKPACQDAGAYCERVDEQIFQESILDRIYNQIAKADLVISDMTGRNPNVFYETGYAHALGKKVILLTQRAEDILFDLKHYPHIVYEGKIAFLKENLGRQVGWYLGEPDTTVLEPHRELEFYTHGQKIAEGHIVKVYQNDYRKVGQQRWALKLNFSIHNPTNRIIDVSSMAIALILPSTATFSELAQDVRLPDGRLMVEPRTYARSITPQAWVSSTFSTNFNTPLIPVSHIQCILRVFNPTGITDIPFTLELSGLPPEYEDAKTSA